MAAYLANCEGVPFDMSHMYATGNLAIDMDCNVAAETIGRVLAVCLPNAAEDSGMKDVWKFLIARDAMHQQHWLAVIEELSGRQGVLPIPNSFPRVQEDQTHNPLFFATDRNGTPPQPGGWTSGPSLDGKGEYSVFQNQPTGEVPALDPACPDSGAGVQRMG